MGCVVAQSKTSREGRIPFNVNGNKTFYIVVVVRICDDAQIVYFSPHVNLLNDVDVPT